MYQLRYINKYPTLKFHIPSNTCDTSIYSSFNWEYKKKVYPNSNQNIVKKVRVDAMQMDIPTTLKLVNLIFTHFKYNKELFMIKKISLYYYNYRV